MNKVVHSFLSAGEACRHFQLQVMGPIQLTASSLRFSSLGMFSCGAISPTPFPSVLGT